MLTKTSLNRPCPANRKALILSCLLSLGCLFCLTYFRSFGDPALFDADTLFPERLFRDLVLENGSLALWTFPMPAYWPDLGLYA
ncbi:MAG: hypothetical protein LIP28_10950, partial [Deltaproteobacteria bacterium]|nr:hypothetical protein [Deltaproteobacteria bacterium]